MSARLLIVGHGALADQVHRLLLMDTDCDIVRQPALQDDVPEGFALALVLHDAWHPLDHDRAEAVFQQAHLPWLRGFVAFGRGLIGPLVLPGVPGCACCADMRRIMADGEQQELFQFRLQLTANGGPDRDPWAAQTSLMHMAHVIVDEAMHALDADQGPQLTEHMIWIHFKTLAVSRHHFLPHPACPICGTLPEDTPEAATIPRQSSPKIHDNSYRCRSIDDLQKVIPRDYLDVRSGLLNVKVHDLITPYAAVSVNLPLMMGNEGTAGRSHSYSECELTAILEGLERYCGIEPRGKRTVIHDTYANVKELALCPVYIGLHAPEQYARPDFPFRPFAEDVPVNWVWGCSLIDHLPILVPELLAYYSLSCQAGFVYETSNGCAVGGSLVEAIFHGILEIVERDAFLLTWYGRLPLPPVDLASIDDREIQWMIHRLRAAAGYDLHLFNATMENGIPSVFAIAKSRRTHGLNLICGAGSHVDPVRAVKSAVHELAGMLLRFDEKLEAHREEYLRMYHDASFVRQMEDHSMLYGLPEAEERLRFLLDDNRPRQSFKQAFQWARKHVDLADDVEDLLEIFRRLKLDVIVVDQTSPELKRNGLYCVKVLIPGMLPMTFGHHLTRLEGLERALRVPYELGYAGQPLTREQLNPHPHPFP